MDSGWASGALPRSRAPLVAALATLLVNVAVCVLGGMYPFGHTSSGFGDFGTQYLPFHAQFHRVLTGTTSLTDLWFTWTSGGGVPFLPDYAYYLGGPFTLLIGWFPSTRIQLGIAVICLLRLCLAASVMAVLLRRLRPRLPAAPTVLLATGYACSSWTYDIAVYTPMWLDSLWCLPLLVLAFIWGLERRRLWASALVVAVTLWCNFYTGYMACLGAALLGVTLVVDRRNWRERGAAAVVRFVVAGVVGVGLTSWLLVPTVISIHRAVPFPPPGQPDTIPTVGLRGFLVRPLPWTEGLIGSPSLYVGSAVLLLALSLPFARHRARRSRIVWTVATLLVFTSANWGPTMWVWNAFDSPQGNPFRFSFVLCAWLCVLAAYAWPAGRPGGSLPAWPPVRQLAGGAVLVLVLVLLAQPGRTRQFSVWTGARIVPLLAVAAMLAAAHFSRRRERWVGPATWSLLGVLTLVELVGTASAIDGMLRVRLGTMPVLASTQAADQATADAQRSASQWPLHRASTVSNSSLPAFTRFNQGLLYDLPTWGYYSSNQPRVTSAALNGLGGFQNMNGRQQRESFTGAAPDPVLGLLLGIQGPQGAGETSVVPLPTVRVLPQADPARGDVFTNRNAVAGTAVYSPGSYVVGGVRHVGATADDIVRIPSGGEVDATFSCTSEQAPVLQLDDLYGSVQPRGGHTIPVNRERIVQLPAGTQTARVNATVATRIYRVGCLNPLNLVRATRQAVQPAITAAPGSISATFPAPQTGDVVVMTTAQPGWSCTVDGKRASVGSRVGFLRVRVDGARTVSCAYREPGLRLGVAGSVLALLGTCFLWWIEVVTPRRRTGRSRRAGGGIAASGVETAPTITHATAPAEAPGDAGGRG